MTKKIMLALCALALLVCNLVACSSNIDDDELLFEDSGSLDPQSTEDANNGTEDSTTEAFDQTSPDFSDIVLVDNEECNITLTGIDPDNADGYVLSVTLENKSLDTAYTFWVADATIEGVETDPYFVTELPAGESAEEKIAFFEKDDLANRGITFSDIAISFEVYYIDGSFEYHYADQETVHIYPEGEENAVAFERASQQNDMILVDNDDFEVILTGIDNDSDFDDEYVLELLLVNKTDEKLYFESDDVFINDRVCDPYFNEFVSAGAYKFTSMFWDLSDFEKYGITEVNEVDFTLIVSEYETWDEIYNEALRIVP